jgi:MFS family permease
VATATAGGLTWRDRALRWGSALRYPGFRLLWLSLMPGTLGMMMGVVAFGFVAYQLTGSATTLAVVNAGWGLPMVVCSPVAGVVADRFSRRHVLLVTQGVVGLSAVAACLLIVSGTVQVWQLLLVTLVQGVAFAFNMPARQALVAELVPREELANALAIQNAGLNFNRVAGPAIGGALLTLPAVGPAGVFAVMAVLYIVVLLALWRLPPAGRPGRVGLPAGPAGSEAGRPAAVRARPSVVGQLGAGLTYVFGRPDLRRLLLLAFLPLLFGMPYQALMPAIAAQVFEVDAAGLGALLTANGLGALGGSIAVAGMVGAGVAARLARLQYLSGILFGSALAGFGLTQAFIPALALVAVVGGAAAAYTALNNTLLMGQTPAEYHGRVMGVYMMTFAAMPLSSLPAAWMAERIGLSPTLTLCGLVSAAVVALLGRRR